MKRLVYVVCFACLSGCIFGPSEVVAPPLDPATSAAKAMEEYDANTDGKISSSEAKASALDPKAGWDSDGDNAISEDEIRQRLERYEALKPGLQAMTCIVLFRNQPLEGAEVVFEPEGFLGDAVELASGTTDRDGVAEMVAEEVLKNDPTLRGIRAALYKVRITHPDIDLPKKYNDETTLFFELSPMDMVQPPTFKLR